MSALDRGLYVHIALAASTNQRFTRQDALQRRTRRFRYSYNWPHHDTIASGVPSVQTALGGYNRDVVPYYNVAIMFTHGMRNQPPFVPKLSCSRIGDSPQRRRGTRPVCWNNCDCMGADLKMKDECRARTSNLMVG